MAIGAVFPFGFGAIHFPERSGHRCEVLILHLLLHFVVIESLHEVLADFCMLLEVGFVVVLGLLIDFLDFGDAEG
jgi:hypothetical protein